MTSIIFKHAPGFNFYPIDHSMWSLGYQRRDNDEIALRIYSPNWREKNEVSMWHNYSLNGYYWPDTFPPDIKVIIDNEGKPDTQLFRVNSNSIDIKMTIDPPQAPGTPKNKERRICWH